MMSLEENEMKKMLLALAGIMLISSLTACMGGRGHDGHGNVCENEYFIGISLIEYFSPCGK